MNGQQLANEIIVALTSAGADASSIQSPFLEAMATAIVMHIQQKGIVVVGSETGTIQ